MSSSLQSIANDIPLSVWVPIATGSVIPYLSALVTRRPNAWTGAATVALSIVSAVLGDLLAHGWDGFDLKLAVLAAIGTWATSRGWYATVAKDSTLIAQAHEALGGSTVFDVSTLPPADPAETGRHTATLDEPAVAGLPPEEDVATSSSDASQP